MKIGIDLGGSHIACGLIDSDYDIIYKFEQNFSIEEKQNISIILIEKISKSIEYVLKENNLSLNDVEYIGIACPGTISNGTIVKAGNLGIANLEVRENLQRRFAKEIFIDNDGKCAAMCEKKLGAIKNFEDCIFLNIGTGIGGAVFLGRQYA